MPKFGVLMGVVGKIHNLYIVLKVPSGTKAVPIGSGESRQAALENAKAQHPRLRPEIVDEASKAVSRGDRVNGIR